MESEIGILGNSSSRDALYNMNICAVILYVLYMYITTNVHGLTLHSYILINDNGASNCLIFDNAIEKLCLSFIMSNW